MQSGPSKEQLESLFKTSRKYFDELAKDYYAKDRDFYNKNIAPFYSYPILNAAKGKNPARLVIAVALFTFIMALGVTMLLFFNHEHTDNIPVKQTEQNHDPVKKAEDKPAVSTKDSVEKEGIDLQDLREELIKKELIKKDNTGKREVRSKPVERQR